MSKLLTGILVLFCAGAIQAGTITYSYDTLNRLTGAEYSSTNKAFWKFDPAGNITQQIVVGGSQSLQSWLFYFSAMDSACSGAWLSPEARFLRRALTAES